MAINLRGVRGDLEPNSFGHTLGLVKGGAKIMAMVELKEREPRDLRLRNQYFPEAKNSVFDTGKKGFIPMPIIIRKLMRHLSASELRVLVYLQTRCSRYFICYPTLEEITYDLNLASRRNLTPHLKALEKKKFIATITAEGKKYFLVHDPRVAIIHLVESGEIDENELSEINRVFDDLKQSVITAKPRAATPKLEPTPIRKAKSG